MKAWNRLSGGYDAKNSTNGRVFFLSNQMPDRYHGVMEERINYLMSCAARGDLTLDEECELLSHASLETGIFLVVELEARMLERKKRERY
jgi:hypothetical protein